jgi:hypothetical protein
MGSHLQTRQYAVIEPAKVQELMPSFPVELLDKSDSVLIVASGDPGRIAYYMVNINRVDRKDSAIDQNPLGVAFIGDESLPSGCFVQHGEWEGRSCTPPTDFWDYIEESGLGRCYPISELPPNRSGPINDLDIESQEQAFQVVIARMKESVEEDATERDSSNGVLPNNGSS